MYHVSKIFIAVIYKLACTHKINNIEDEKQKLHNYEEDIS